MMKAKYLILAALAVANYPFYRAIFRILFRGMARKDDLPAADGADPAAEAAETPGNEGKKSRKKGGSYGLPRLSDFRDPDFLHDGGGENKLFLLVLASVLIVLIEYYALLSIFPGLRDAAILGLAACRAAISC
jgi:hypothetical protein